ncbi:hypothetical protein SDC9_131533 [bioreactor metagenome]|uniref:Uncharacterized protein n=1 Tax=bioreactor metagenome TaxID=1076179 RepID=A0A645D5F2_9ZZZZ
MAGRTAYSDTRYIYVNDRRSGLVFAGMDHMAGKRGARQCRPCSEDPRCIQSSFRFNGSGALHRFVYDKRLLRHQFHHSNSKRRAFRYIFKAASCPVRRIPAVENVYFLCHAVSCADQSIFRRFNTRRRQRNALLRHSQARRSCML